MYVRYTIKNQLGKKECGTSETASEADAIRSFRNSGAIVLQLHPISENAFFRGKLPPSWHPAWLLRVRILDVEIALRQLSSMLRSGISILTALRLLAEQSRVPRAALLWYRIEHAVSKGKTFSEAIRLESPLFSGYVAELCAMGEQTGELDSTLERAAHHLASMRELKTSILNAILYPALALLAAFGLSVYLILVVLPKLEAFLTAGGAQLPALTQSLLCFSAWLHDNGLWLLFSLIALCLCWRLVRQTKSGRIGTDAFLLKIPVFGPVFRLSGTAVAARGIAVLVESAIPLPEALLSTSHLLSNRFQARQLDEVRLDVLHGESLSNALASKKSFLPLLGRMCAVAESSGTLFSTLAEVASFHEKELADRIRRLSVLLEPVVIGLSAFFVGFIYLAFFLALFSIADLA
ncbi:MAG: type II secretion system F family protein [Kiritimatiellia bacterium]